MTPDNWGDDEERIAQQLYHCERAWLGGDARGLADAVRICDERPLPQWARDGIRAFIGKHRQKASRRDRIHYTRWDKVQEIRDRKEELERLGVAAKWTDDNVYITAAEALEGTEAECGPDAVKKSYLYVQRMFRAGKGSLFF